MPPVAKPALQRQRRNRVTTATVVEARPAERPTLPAEYHDLTRAWWGTIWDSPISAEWVDADTPALIALAQLLEDFWRAPREGRPKAHAEFRMAAREFGLTPMSRRSLQWEVKRVEGAKPVPQREAPTGDPRTRLRALA